MHDQNSESLAYLAASDAALGKLDAAKASAKAIMALEPVFSLEKFSSRLAAAKLQFREALLARLALAALPQESSVPTSPPAIADKTKPEP
jgi:hypothetical protein